THTQLKKQKKTPSLCAPPRGAPNKLSVLVLIKLSYLSPYTISLLSSAKANNNAKNISTKPN
ncbi:MAG: hypothetical protein ACK5ZE_11535, partial [Pseudanabaena sp.]